MSNSIQYITTKFTDVEPKTGKLTNVYWGFRVYDDYHKDYSNCYQKEDLPKTPKEAYLAILGVDDNEGDWEWAIMQEGGFFFDGKWVSRESVVDEKGAKRKNNG